MWKFWYRWIKVNYGSDTIKSIRTKKCALGGSHRRWMGTRRAGFTFIEVVTAIVILGLITGSVLVVLNRSIEAVIDGRVRMQTFELARRNMEKLLASNLVTDTAEFGVHELNEDIEWETVIEPFDEPVKSRMWIRAVCSASFTDRYGERQRIELTHWLTQLTRVQEKQVREQQRRQQAFLDRAEGNPFGNDPDGLMQYGQALVSMGDYAMAAEAFARIPLHFPDSELVDLALKKILSVMELLAMTDLAAAINIAQQLVELFPDVPEFQELLDELLGRTPEPPEDIFPELPEDIPPEPLE